MDIQDKTFTETKTACMMDYEILDIDLHIGFMTVSIQLKDKDGLTIQCYTKTYPIKDYLNTEALCKKVCEDIEVCPC